MEDAASTNQDWYPTRFTRPPLWRLALVLLVELGLGIGSIVLFKRQWVPTAFGLIPLFVLAVWHWRGSAKPDLSHEGESWSRAAERTEPADAQGPTPEEDGPPRQ